MEHECKCEKRKEYEKELKKLEQQFEQAKAQLEIQRMQTEFQLKQQVMQLQHEFDMDLKELEVQGMQEKENRIEDRKDKRTKMEGTQQSKMIEQRQTQGFPTNFERETPGQFQPEGI